MLWYSFLFLILAIACGIFGLFGMASGAAGIAKILFVVFLVMFGVSLLFGRRPGPPAVL